MITVVKLNDTLLEHKDGLIYEDNLNETLDSGIVVCESIDRLDITPLDKLDIKFPNVNYERAMIISSFNEEVASYNPPKYNYAIQYVSPVLLTERITLPNLTIKRVYKTSNDEDWLVKENGYYSRSVAYYIYQYMNEYFDLGEWMLSAELELLAMDKICPEMSFDRPNLKEVMNALLQTLDLIFYIDMIKSGDKYVYIIKGLNPNIEGNAIDTSKLDRDIIKQSANYYASNLDIELTNSISNKLTKSIQYLTPRTDDAILTTDNATLYTQSPIYAIDKVELHAGAFDFVGSTATDKIKLDWVDITDYVVEKSVYEGLKVKGDDSGVYKNNAIYYTQGDNKIEGLGKSEKLLGLFDSGAALTNILIRIIFAEYGVPPSSSNTDEISKVIKDNLLKLMFRITYQTQQDVKMQTEKAIKTKHKSSLFDSQDSKFVNVELFGRNSFNTINKLGNPERTINAVYTNYNDIPQLGDYIDDYILTNRTISIYDDYVVFEGNLTKDFAYKYQFNAIDSKKRFYNISDEALVRHELIKKYCVFDFEDDVEANKDLAFNVLAFGNMVGEYATLQFDLGNGIKTEKIMSEVSTYQEGNSVGITFGFDNNIIVGNSRGTSDTGGYYQEPVKYVNELGENYGVDIVVYRNMVNNTFADKDAYLTYSNTIASYFPIAKEGFDIFSNKLYEANSTKHKDQSEIQKWTLQYTFVSNDERIILGDAWYEQNAFLESSKDKTLKIIKYNKKFNIRNINELDNSYIESFDITNDSFEYGENYYVFKNLSGNVGLVYDNQLMLGINDYIAGTPIYLNIRNNR